MMCTLYVPKNEMDQTKEVVYKGWAVLLLWSRAYRDTRSSPVKANKARSGDKKKRKEKKGSHSRHYPALMPQLFLAPR